MKLCPTCKGQCGGGEVFCPVDATRLLTASQMDSTGAVDPNDPLIGMVLAGRYKVLERIGEGGMGLVYSGLHSLIDKRVAIKVLRDDFSSRPDVVARFRQEAKSASRIGHEHIVDIFDFGETPWGASYFVMEYLEGEDLANVLHRETVVSPGRTIELARQCCRALGAAHSKGIVHRDMKPENIYLVRRDDHSEFVKIVDFGIAKMSDIETDGAPGRKLTKTGMIFGTPEYMSPEQAAGKALDHRVDVYAMGVILYECITGRVPFVGDTFMGVLTQHMFEPPPPLRETNPHIDCPHALERVIYKALSKDPDDRYQRMDHLDRALELAAEGKVSEHTLHGHGSPIKATRVSVRPAGGVPKQSAEFELQRARQAPSAAQGSQGAPSPWRGRLAWVAAGLLGAIIVVGAVVAMTRSSAPEQSATDRPQHVAAQSTKETDTRQPREAVMSARESGSSFRLSLGAETGATGATMVRSPGVSGGLEVRAYGV